MKHTMTINQYAKKLGVSWEKVNQWIESGELPAINVAASKNGKLPRWRITLDAIREFEESRMSAGAPT
jgi:excisionase family DNA binding protein